MSITPPPSPGQSRPRINIIRNIIRTARQPQSCLFCNSNRHTIAVCNCDGLRIFIDYTDNLKYSFIMTLINGHDTLNNILNEFANIINNWSENQIRTYCSKVMKVSSMHVISTDNCKLLIVGDFKLCAERILNNPDRTNATIERHLRLIPDDNIILFNMYRTNEDNIIQQPIGQIPTSTSHIRFVKTPHTEQCCKECPVCYDNVEISQQITFNCDHIMCGQCVGQLVKYSSNNDVICPLCRSCINTMNYNATECLYNNNITSNISITIS